MGKVTVALGQDGEAMPNVRPYRARIASSTFMDGVVNAIKKR
jgi:hypothetical protein